MEVTDLTVEDLLRIFNDPEGELLNHPFKSKTDFNRSAAELLHMDVPYDAIKAMVNNVKKEFFANFDSKAPKPAFEHAGSTSIRGNKCYNEYYDR